MEAGMVNAMSVLVTGGTGLVGTKLVSSCMKRGLDAYATYLSHPPPQVFKEKEIFFKLDVTDAKSTASMISELKPDVVMNAAAMLDTDLCEVEREAAWKVNALGARNVAEACSRTGAHLVQLSTSYVFDGEKGHYDEEAVPNPVNQYGYTKLKGEEFVRKSNCKWCIVRTDVVFGWERPHRPNFAMWVINSLEKKEQITVAEDQYNSPTLNTSLADMIIETAQKNTQGTLNLAGTTRLSRLDFAYKICRVLQLDKKYVRPVKMEETDLKARRPRDSSLRVKKAEKLLSNKPMSIDGALKTLKRERNSY
jgi:dTDP-4-dehydrorhamnose reductase